tara:strand:+ start:34 stop:492 length:459 start_codon:yes stop_codon:yes gene_type:complete
MSKSTPNQHLNGNFHWFCIDTWKRSSKNTFWCLIGCSIGDFGTILFFQLFTSGFSNFFIMILAIINGIITSIILETFILSKQMKLKEAFKVAIGMSFISMLIMEISMNLIDFIIIGKALIVWWIIPIMLFFGFFSALPYNYWNLKKYDISCH